MKKKTKPSNKSKKPWPTKDAMEQIYALNLWGGTDSSFYSGSGSHHQDIVNPYIEVVTSFLNSFKTPPVVCDLGCGDFNIGKELVSYAGKYVAVDIVEDLIKYNSDIFQQENLKFHCLDIAVDEIPSGDIVILRQVLQHLSNPEIHSILDKLRDFKYLILTEHLPEGDFEPNLEIISGRGTRLKKNSGVKITALPFSFNVSEEKRLLSIPARDHKGNIDTYLYKVN